MSKRRWIDRMTEEAAEARKPAPWAHASKPTIRVTRETVADGLTDAA